MFKRSISVLFTRTPVVLLRNFTAKPKYQLTSTTIATTADGSYPWDAVALLLGHEMIRRELGRGTLALNNFNLMLKPWHAFCFSEWYGTFMAPLIKEHHSIEDDVFNPSYSGVGIVFPDIFKNDHGGLMKLVDEIGDLAQQVDAQAAIPTVEALSVMNAKGEELKMMYRKLVEFSNSHMAVEEKFWLQHLKLNGEDFYYKVQENVAEYTMKRFNHTYGQNFCSMLTCMGVKIRDSHVKDEPDLGWAGVKMREHYVTMVNPDVVNGVLPEWNIKYTIARLLIDGIVDENDISAIESKITQLSSRPEKPRVH